MPSALPWFLGKPTGRKIPGPRAWAEGTKDSAVEAPKRPWLMLQSTWLTAAFSTQKQNLAFWQRQVADHFSCIDFSAEMPLDHFHGLSTVVSELWIWTAVITGGRDKSLAVTDWISFMPRQQNGGISKGPRLRTLQRWRIVSRDVSSSKTCCPLLAVRYRSLMAFLPSSVATNGLSALNLSQDFATFLELCKPGNSHFREWRRWSLLYWIPSLNLYVDD